MRNNSLGLLPNDRTHAFKFYGSYPFSFGLTIGVSGYWTSGTPVSEFGSGSSPGRMADLSATSRHLGKDARRSGMRASGWSMISESSLEQTGTLGLLLTFCTCSVRKQKS